MFQAPLLGGLFIGILSALPVINIGNCCCCLWVVTGGALAAYLDQQNDSQPITAGRGARAGLLAGMAGAVVWLIVSIALDAILSPVREQLIGSLMRVARDMPPDARAVLEQMRESSPVGKVLDFVAMLCAGAIFSTLGGVLGAAFFRKDVPPALGGPIEPPPLPPA